MVRPTMVWLRTPILLALCTFPRYVCLLYPVPYIPQSLRRILAPAS